MNIFGFNIQQPGAGMDLIERYKPVATLLMDIKSEHVAIVREKSPLTEIIYRKEDGKQWREKDPVKWAKAMWADVQDCPPHLVVADNEPLGHAAAHEFAAFDQWQRAFADWIHENTPMSVGMFSFSEGNFTKDGPVIPDHFPLSMEVARAVFIHEYWKPHLYSDGMEGYHCLRWPYWLEWFEKAGYPNLPIYVTETGITMAVAGGPNDVGYASEEAKEAGVTSETYLADLEEYHRRCCAEPRIRAVLPFVFCPWPGEWGTFVPTEEMTQKMFLFDAPIPEPKPNGGSKMRVFDKDGTELFGPDAENLVAYYGLSVENPAGLQDGDHYFRLTVLREKVSTNAAYIARVLDEAGNPIINPDETLDRSKAHRAFWWPNMGDSNDIETAFPTDRHLEADLGGLNDNGEGGSGMGPGAFHDPNTPGPHEAWIRHPTIPSALLKGIGMIGNTNHDHMDSESQEEVYRSDEPLPPDVVGEIIKHAEKIIDLTSSLGTTVAHVSVVYDNGKVENFVRATTGSLARVWAKVKMLLGQQEI